MRATTPWLVLLLAPLLLFGLLGILHPEGGARTGPGAAGDLTEALADGLVYEDDRVRTSTWVVLDADHERLAQTLAPETAEWDRVRGLLAPVRWCSVRVRELPPLSLIACVHPDGTPHSWSLRGHIQGSDDPDPTPDEARVTAEAVLGELQLATAGWSDVESSSETLPSGRTRHRFSWQGTPDLGGVHARAHVTMVGARVVEAGSELTPSETQQERQAHQQRLKGRVSALAGNVPVGAWVVLGVLLGARARSRVSWRLVAGMSVVLTAAAVCDATASELARLPRTFDPLTTPWPQHVRSARFEVAKVAVTALMVFVPTAFAAAHARRWFWRGGTGTTFAPARWGDALALGAALPVALAAWEVAFYLGLAPLLGFTGDVGGPVTPTALTLVETVGFSVVAGLWEELAFRFVGLAVAVHGLRRVLSERWAWRVAIVATALVFAAAHADQPQGPWWLRVVELTPPAVVAALVVRRLGLLPAVVAHTLYDIAVFAGPAVEAGRPLLTVAVLGVGWTPLALALAGRVVSRTQPPRGSKQS